MRIVAGSGKGRALKSVPGHTTRPTTDKVKEAVFSRIGPYFSGGSVLDLYAGTGAMGIEALSRGMHTGVFIDQDYKAVATVRANLHLSGFIQAAEVYRNDAERALPILQKRALQFDLVIVDPPYQAKTTANMLDLLAGSELLRPEADVVVEHSRAQTLEDAFGLLKKVRDAIYGETKVTYYVYANERGRDNGRPPR